MTELDRLKQAHDELQSKYDSLLRENIHHKLIAVELASIHRPTSRVLH